MINRTKDKTWKGVPAMCAILAMPIIIAMMVFPVSLWAESSVPQEEAEGRVATPAHDCPDSD